MMEVKADGEVDVGVVDDVDVGQTDEDVDAALQATVLYFGYLLNGAAQFAAVENGAAAFAAVVAVECKVAGVMQENFVNVLNSAAFAEKNVFLLADDVEQLPEEMQVFVLDSDTDTASH